MQFPASRPSKPQAHRVPRSQAETGRPCAHPQPQPYHAPHKADTFAWIIEQEFVKIDESNRNTEQWIYEQRIRFPKGPERHDIEERVRRRMWEDMMKRYEIEAERWSRHEEQRKAAEERHRQRAKIAQEEMRRKEAELRYREMLERRRAEEERQRIQTGLREQRRLKTERTIIDAWKRYEQNWSTLATCSGPLAFSDIPWPTVVPPTKPDDITIADLSAFLLSPLHSPTQMAKDRIRSAQLRWHPDRFHLLGKVKDSDKEAVAEAAGKIARYLNDLNRRQVSPFLEQMVKY
ncbi:hypothetical protein D9758_002003 [Tetrapyrgos nigripes]|uniref:J domain-containing protein n=1 Tax=Tetrapyrgos nigripes TaxID=182062 RepID=A0A8H5GTM5_9AGAR|nr:hypothetical protein D9758_002003 [Tetrapyrgos nigripes]